MYTPKQPPAWDGRELLELGTVVRFKSVTEAIQAMEKAWIVKQTAGEISPDTMGQVVKLMCRDHTLLVVVDTTLKRAYDDIIIAEVMYVDIKDDEAERFERMGELVWKKPESIN